jgi:hypothetical protein
VKLKSHLIPAVMKNLIVILGVSCLIVACSTTKSVSDNSSNQNSVSINSVKDGSSYEKAIFITEKSEAKGVDAEYVWLKKNYPGYHLKQQSLRNYNKKSYDVLSIVTAQGQDKDVYFDISNFFGKF